VGVGVIGRHAQGFLGNPIAYWRLEKLKFGGLVTVEAPSATDVGVGTVQDVFRGSFFNAESGKLHHDFPWRLGSKYGCCLCDFC
jgi:hypothetical protein